jgi:hypothetical protein
MHKLAPLLIVSVLAFSVTAAAAPAPNTKAMKAGGPRVRVNDERSASLLLEGLNRSETLRHLVDELEQRDVIVYIEIQPALVRRLAGSLKWVIATKSMRYVRISLNPDLNTDLLIATLGHELQHALEIAREPSIVSTATLIDYYAKHGLSMKVHDNGWDTLAARQTGDDVRRELATRASRVVESTQDFNPESLIVYRRARSMLPP